MRTLLAAISVWAFGAFGAGTIAGTGGEGAAPEMAQSQGSAALETHEGFIEKNLSNGLVMSGTFTYLMTGGTAYITLDQIQNNSTTRTTGTLRLSLWALTYQPVRFAGITGYKLANFSTFNALSPNTYYYNISRSASYLNPPDGSYWLVLVLDEYNPTACPTSTDGYCLNDDIVSYTQQTFSTAAPSYSYTDIWYSPSEPGWGLSITHHSSNDAFIAWYTYDEVGRPKWYYLDTCIMMGNSCSGPVYETSGPAFGPTFNSSLVKSTPVGTVTLTFSAFGTGTMSYYVKGVSAVKSIVRLSF